jgi:hypothetical protein
VVEATRAATGDRQHFFVWHSTAASVESGTISILAACEVIVAVILYWFVAVWLHTQAHLWISIAIAPLLLLRSEASVALGVKWFEHYIDAGFRQSPEQAIRSLRAWLAAVPAAIGIGWVACSLSRGFLLGTPDWRTVSYAVIVGYLSSQVGVVIVGTIALHELIVLMAWRSIAALVAFATVIAVSVGVLISGAGLVSGLVVVATTAALAILGMSRAPPVGQAIGRASATTNEESHGITAGREVLTKEPLSFLIFAPALFFGGWLRTLAIRFAATAPHLWAGILSLPENWRRTLFAIDLSYPPEIIPGYRKPDLGQISYLMAEIKQGANSLERLVWLIGFVIMFLPAYFYRLTIKSTCWFYLPIIYIVRTQRLSTNPRLLADLLWTNPFEWWRRFLATLVLGTLVASHAIAASARAALPTEIVSPLEYVFLIDPGAIKPWQWFNLGSALLTVIIFLCAGTFRIFVRHARTDNSLRRVVSWRAIFLEYCMRLRNVSTGLFLLIAFLHVLVWKVPEYVPSYIHELLGYLFG